MLALVSMLPAAVRWSRLGLDLAEAQKRRRRRRRQRLLRHAERGRCPLCEREVDLVPFDAGERETPRCVDCGSAPRHRALASVLLELWPDLRALAVHESSPSDCTARWLRRRCGTFTGSYWLPHKRPGARLGVFTNVDLGAQPFADASFDLVVTQDVLEHLPEPLPALREIHRTLKPGGRHVFTVPRRTDAPTSLRARWQGNAFVHLLPAQYHHDPSSRGGSLVVTDWGADLEALVSSTGTACERREVQVPELGIPSLVEVFVATRST
jgi:SAM-dependent methyltransferase